MALFGSDRLRADMGVMPPGAVPFFPTPDDRAAALALAGQGSAGPIPTSRPDMMGPRDLPASQSMQGAVAAPAPPLPSPGSPNSGGLPAPRGMFGNALATDPRSSPQTGSPPGMTPPAPVSISMPDPGTLAMPNGPNLSLDLSNAKVRHPHFFEHGGVGEKILHGLGEFALRYSASQGDPAALMTLRNRIEEKQRLQNRQWAIEDRDAALYAPQYFNSGRDRVRLDPRSGESQVLYDGPEDYQQYASTLGLNPGDDGYDDAVRDYVLRSSGPTAYQNRTDLEGVRQQDRVSLEGVRQGNRAALRSMPTYSNLHPRPAGGGGGGRAPSSHRTGYADVYAPILAKMARGEPLTPGEQQALSMRGRRGGGGIPNGQGQAVTPGGGAPRSPGTRDNPAVLTHPNDYTYLPKGTYFRDPQGHVRVKQ